MVNHGVTSLEVKVDAEKIYNEQLHARLAKTVWNGGCNSWYTQNGKNVAGYPGMVTELVRACANPPLENFIQIGGTKRLAVSHRAGQVFKLVLLVAAVLAVRHIGFEQVKGQVLLFVLVRSLFISSRRIRILTHGVIGSSAAGAGIVGWAPSIEFVCLGFGAV